MFLLDSPVVSMSVVCCWLTPDILKIRLPSHLRWCCRAKWRLPVACLCWDMSGDNVPLEHWRAPFTPTETLCVRCQASMTSCDAFDVVSDFDVRLSLRAARSWLRHFHENLSTVLCPRVAFDTWEMSSSAHDLGFSRFAAARLTARDSSGCYRANRRARGGDRRLCEGVCCCPLCNHAKWFQTNRHSGNESNQSRLEKNLKLEKEVLFVKSQVCRTILISGGSGRLQLQAETIFSRFVSSVESSSQPADEMKRTNVLIFVQYWTLLPLWKSAIIAGNLGTHERSSLLPVPLPLCNSVPLSAPRITSPNWSWQRVSLKLSVRLTDGIHFSSGLSIKMDSNSPHNFPGRPQKLTLFVRAQQLIK